MNKLFGRSSYSAIFVAVAAVFVAVGAFAATKGTVPAAADQGMTLWKLLVAGGSCMIFLGLVSIAATASVIYHFKYVTPGRLTPPDLIENLISLLEKKQYDRAKSLCRQQPNIISAITIKGLEKLDRGKSVVEEAIQYEGKEKIEGLWQNLGYLGDMAVVAPMLGLLGTVLGMIQAFNYQSFSSGIVKPILLAQGLAKAMITTAAGLIIAVPILVLYSYFRGRISTITSNAERASAEIMQAISR